MDEGNTTCGVGECERTVNDCVDGQPQPCVPGDPLPEVNNGLDDDCDGLVDEERIQAECTLSPSTLNLKAQGSTFSFDCKLLDLLDPRNPVPVPGAEVGIVHLSRADATGTSSDDEVLPDPASLPCPDPVLGLLYERGIVETLSDRQNNPKGATFNFVVPQDGSCDTLEGDRQDLAARLATIPDNTRATVCIAGKARGADFSGCFQALVRNKGLR